jgi:hypothetical protein
MLCVIELCNFRRNKRDSGDEDDYDKDDDDGVEDDDRNDNAQWVVH